MEPGKPIPEKEFFRIGEVARLLGVKPYVLRYWETEFPMVAPRKSAHNQRVYRRSEVETLVLIKHLLYEEKYSIEGARKRVRKLRSGEAPQGAALSSKDAQELCERAREIIQLARTPISRLFFLIRIRDQPEHRFLFASPRA